jgi:hypothetical protein
MLKDLEKTVFLLKEGELSHPVRTPFGVHLFLVTKRTRAGVKPFKDVRNKVEASLRDQRARAEAKKKLRLVRYDIEDKKTGQKLVGMQTGETGFFERRTPPAAAPEGNIFSGLVFSLKKKGSYSTEKVGARGVIFVRLLDMKKPEIPPFKSVEAKARQRVIFQKAQKFADMKIKAWEAELQKGGKTLGGLATLLKTKTTRPEPFSRLNPPAELSQGPAAVDKVFQLKKSRVAVLKARGDIVIVLATESPKVDMSKYKSEKDKLWKSLLAGKKRNIILRRMDNLKKAAKIRIEGGFSL